MSPYERYMKSLPIIPEVAQRVINIAEDKIDISFNELERLIMVDPGLTTKILRIANSALYARQKEVKSLQDAIVLLGFKSIKSLVMLISASNMFITQRKTEFYFYFWKHSLITSFLSKYIILRSDRKTQSEQAFLGGLLHNVGQIALFNADREKYGEIIRRVKNNEEGFEMWERKLYGTDHKEIGASVFQEWSFPDFYVDVASEHEMPNIRSPYKPMIIIISVAALLADMIDSGKALKSKKEELLSGYLPYLGLKPENFDRYKEKYIRGIMDDPLLKECEDLFGIDVTSSISSSTNLSIK